MKTQESAFRNCTWSQRFGEGIEPAVGSFVKIRGCQSPDPPVRFHPTATFSEGVPLRIRFQQHPLR